MLTKDILGCVAWVAFFLLGAAWIPMVGPFLSLLTPLPFLYYATKLGTRQGALLAGLTALAVGLGARLAGFSQILILTLEFGLLGILLAELYRRKATIGQTVFLATGVMLVLSFALLFVFAMGSNRGPLQLLVDYLQGQLEATMKSYQDMGLSPEQSAELQEFGKVYLGKLQRIFPALMTLGTGFVAWLNVVLSRPLLRMRNLPEPEFGTLDRWRAPDRLVWVVIFSGFGLLLTSGGLQWTAVNFLIVAMAIYMFHGLSILQFFLNKFRVPTWARTGVYILLILQQLFLLLLAVAGLFDQWIDFRKIHRRVSG